MNTDFCIYTEESHPCNFYCTVEIPPSVLLRGSTTPIYQFFDFSKTIRDISMKFCTHIRCLITFVSANFQACELTCFHFIIRKQFFDTLSPPPPQIFLGGRSMLNFLFSIVCPDPSVCEISI